jgi:Xaa-Pro aminopeptidase
MSSIAYDPPLVVAISNEEYAERRDRLGALLEERGIDALFVPQSSDLEYLTGIERDLPTFGNISYAHGWVAGAFLAPGRDPVYVLPRMVVDFHLDGVPPPGARVVKENGDGRASFAEAVRSLGEPQRIALGQRVWAETVIELRQVVPDAELLRGRRS